MLKEKVPSWRALCKKISHVVYMINNAKVPS